MPFAGYDDFEDCVRKNSDKADPKGYCATIMRKTEGASNHNHEHTEFEEAGFRDFFDKLKNKLEDVFKSQEEEVEFETQEDERVCQICAKLDGKTFDINPKTGVIDGPVIPEDTHPNCRCYYDFEDGSGVLNVGETKLKKGKVEPVVAKKVRFNLPKKAKAVKLASVIYKQAATSEENNSKLYIRRFLLDTSVNLNQWGVSEASIDENISSFIGKPFVLTPALDHPLEENESIAHNMAYQEQFRIGTIIDVVKQGSRYDAIIEITNKDAADEIRAGNVPVYVSPAIAHDPTESETNISRWMGMHLAAVSEPAFGVKKTSKASHCDGTKERCLMVLRKASIEKNGVGNCGFCVRAALRSATIGSSLENESKHKEAMADTPVASVSATFTKAQVDELVAKINAEYEAKIKNLESEVAAKTKTNEELGTRVAAIEKERRTEQINNIITAEVYAKKEDLESVRKSYIENTVPIETIKATFAPLVAQAQKVKKASVNAGIKFAEDGETATSATDSKVDFSVLGSGVI